MIRSVVVLAVLAALVAWVLMAPTLASEKELIHVSYDSTREAYGVINRMFADQERAAGRSVAVRQSHGGSSKQARAVLDGLPAHVVSLALGADLLPLQHVGLVADSPEALSVPCTSTVVMVVRGGNPRGIRDWDDLARPDVRVIIANPRTSGGARWGFLALWGHAASLAADEPASLRRPRAAVAVLAGNEKARRFVRAVFGNVPVLDTSTRAASATFAMRGIGDALVAWEAEAWNLIDENGAERFKIIYPSRSILAEPPVALVRRADDDPGGRALAESYVRFLSSPAAQRVFALFRFRPTDPHTARLFADDLPPLPMFTIDEFGGWETAQRTYFGGGGVFDSLDLAGR